MRPVLVSIPSKFLFAVALLLAVATAVRHLLARRKDKDAKRSSSVPTFLIGALVVYRVGVGDFSMPSAATFARGWAPVPIYAYGVMLGTSLIVGWFVAMKFAKQDGIRQEDAAGIYMWTAVWSIVGARLLYVVANFKDFHGIVDVLMVNRGGLVAYGGMIGGFCASWFGCVRRKIPLLQWADASAPPLALGTGITRIGCFLFGCDYGRRTSSFLGVAFPRERPGTPDPSPAWTHHHRDLPVPDRLPDDAAFSYPVHPTQLYEMLVGFALFALLVHMRKKRKFSGQVFVTWVIGYGILRPLIEVLRDDTQRGSVGPLSTSQFIGITATVLGIVLLAHLRRRHREDPVSLRLWEHPAMAGDAPDPDAPQEGGGRGKRKKRR